MAGIVTETKEGLHSVTRYWMFFAVVLILLSTVFIGTLIQVGNSLYKVPVLGAILSKLNTVGAAATAKNSTTTSS
jgi:hypothetical protein